MILTTLSISPHKYYPVSIEGHDGQFYDYYWLHMGPWKDFEYVDWPNSKFVIKKFSRIEGEVVLRSYEDYISKSRELGKIRMIQMNLMKVKKIPYDVFTLPLVSDLIISGNAYELCQSITGISIEPFEQLMFSKDQDRDHLS
jgi:hypothetical protein